MENTLNIINIEYSIIIFCVILSVILSVRFFFSNSEKFTQSLCPPGKKGKKCRRRLRKMINTTTSIIKNDKKFMLDSFDSEEEPSIMEEEPIMASLMND